MASKAWTIQKIVRHFSITSQLCKWPFLCDAAHKTSRTFSAMLSLPSVDTVARIRSIIVVAGSVIVTGKEITFVEV